MFVDARMEDIFSLRLTVPSSRFQSRFDAEIQQLSDLIHLEKSACMLESLAFVPDRDAATFSPFALRLSRLGNEVKRLDIEARLQRELVHLIYTALKQSERQKAFPLLHGLAQQYCITSSISTSERSVEAFEVKKEKSHQGEDAGDGVFLDCSSGTGFSE